jgi:hypothetical protein
VAAEAFVEGFEALDQISDVFARVHAAGLSAEMGAAAERAVLIDGAASVAAEERAGTVWVWFEDFAAAAAHAVGCVERLASREQRRVAGDAKMAAACAHFALAGQGTALQLGVDGLDLGTMRGRFRVFHAAWSQHGRAGICGTRFLQSGI